MHRWQEPDQTIKDCGRVTAPLKVKHCKCRPVSCVNQGQSVEKTRSKIDCHELIKEECEERRIHGQLTCQELTRWCKDSRCH